MPPNVRGFLTGTNWINTATIHARQQTAAQITNQWKTEVLVEQYKNTPLPVLTPAQYGQWASTIMDVPPVLVAPTTNLPINQAAYKLLSDPAYWLK